MPLPLPLLAPLWLLASAPLPSELAPDEVDAVEVSWAEVQAMRAMLEDDPAATPPGPWAKEREIELHPVDGGLLLLGRWTIVAPRAGWVAQELLGPGIELHGASLDGQPAPTITMPGGTTAGSTMLVAWVERDVELKVRAFVPTPTLERLALALMPATRGRLRVAVPGRVPVPIVGEAAAEAPPVLDGGVVWTGARAVALELRDPDHAPPARETLAVAHAGMGLTVGDAELRGRAHLQWELRHGTLTRVRATVRGLGDDLTVEGRDVARWSLEGESLEVELSAPVATRVDLELRWTQAIGAADQARLPLPHIEPEAWRSESTLQLARDGEIEVIPEVTEGTAIASAALPSWGQGLVEGTPSAAYERAHGSAEGHLDLLRFVPVPGPPTVIDVATYTVATTDEGRVLLKAHYDLRNDRGAHLTVRPPPGLRIIGARVGRETALPSRGDDGAWRIPLRRSLETVDGLLSFPVEVIMLGEQEPWKRRERRELPLPTLDAPVAAAQATVYLPPGYRSRLEPGERNVVEEFGEGEGLTYGRGVGADDAAVVDALFEDAVQGYLENDFEQAQTKLAQLEQLGVDNENMARLQANIDVIEGKAEAKDKGDLTLQRRVKEQARVRAAEDFRRQESLIAEAEEAASAGDYAQAEAQYEAALDLGGKLAKLEQSESVEQQVKNADVQLELQTVNEKKVKKSKKVEARERERLLALEERMTGGQPFRKAANYQDPNATAPVSDSIALGGDEAPLSGVEAEGSATGTSSTPTPDEPALDPSRVEDPSRNGAAVEQAPAEPQPAQPEPEPQRNESLDADRGLERLEEGADAPRLTSRRSRRERRTRRDLLDTKFESVTREPSRRRARGARAGAKATSATAVTVYDFEDDSLDGAVVTPDGANLSSRTRATASSSPMGDASSVPETLAPPADLAPDDHAPARRDAALPPPEVTASALSVVVPATGEAVRYEQLLLDANQPQILLIHARRRLRR